MGYVDLFTAVRQSLLSHFKWSTEAYVFDGYTYLRVILRVGNNEYDFRCEPWEDSTLWRRLFNSRVRDLKDKAIKDAWRDGI